MDLHLTQPLILVTEVGLSWHTLCLYTEFGEGGCLKKNNQSGTTTQCYTSMCINFARSFYLFILERKCMQNTLFPANNGKHNQLIGLDKQNLAIHTQNVL